MIVRDGDEIELDARLVLLGEDAQQLTILTGAIGSAAARRKKIQQVGSDPAAVAPKEDQSAEIQELRQRISLLEQTVAALQSSLLTSMQYELEKTKQICLKYTDERIKRVSSVQSPISSPASALRGFLNTISEDEEEDEEESTETPFATSNHTTPLEDEQEEQELPSDFVRTGEKPLALNISAPSDHEDIHLITTPPRHPVKTTQASRPDTFSFTSRAPSHKRTTSLSTLLNPMDMNSTVQQQSSSPIPQSESDELSVNSSHTTSLSVDDDGLVIAEDSDVNEFNSTTAENILLTNFWKACVSGALDEVQGILGEWTIDVNAPNRTGFTALHQAAFAGQAHVVEYLLKSAKANPNLTGAMGWTPLHLAASAGHDNFVQVRISLPQWRTIS